MLRVCRPANLGSTHPHTPSEFPGKKTLKPSDRYYGRLRLRATLRSSLSAFQFFRFSFPLSVFLKRSTEAVVYRFAGAQTKNTAWVFGLWFGSSIIRIRIGIRKRNRIDQPPAYLTDNVNEVFVKQLKI